MVIRVCSDRIYIQKARLLRERDLLPRERDLSKGQNAVVK